MATLRDYLGNISLGDAWPRWKANTIAVNNQVIGHVAGTADKHAAQDITYSGSFTGKTDAKAAIDRAKTEIDTIVVNASIDPEVAFARDSAVKSKVFGSLDARLEEDEQDRVTDKAETTTRIDNIIVTPAEGITEQEIIDARFGEGSLGTKIGLMDAELTGVTELAGETSVLANDLQVSTSKRLGTLEDQSDVLSKINLNRESVISVSTYVSANLLPKNAANGQVGASLKGSTATNLVVNGNFSLDSDSDGIADDWEQYGDTGFTAKSVSNNIQYLVGGVSCGFRMSGGDAPLGIVATTDKFYFSFNYKSTGEFGTYQPTQYTLQLSADFVKVSGVAIGLNTSSNNFTFDLFEETKEFWLKNMICINLTATFGAGNEPTVEQCDLMFPNWFDGTKSTLSTRVKSVGKNLFDMSKLSPSSGYVLLAADGTLSSAPNGIISGYVVIKPNTSYALSKGLGSGGYGHCFYDGNKNFISGVLSGTLGSQIITTPADAKYVRISLLVKNLLVQQLELGSLSTAYEPYKESVSFINLPSGEELRSLPNGTKDEVNVSDGKLIKRISGEYVLQASDILTVLDLANVQRISIDKTNMQGIVEATAGNSSGQIKMGSFREYTGLASGADDLANINTYFYNLTYSSDIFILVPLGTYVDLASAEVGLVGTKVTYQFTTPVETPLAISGKLYSYPSGTIYFQNAIGDIDFYGAGIVIAGTTFQDILKVTKVDMESGTEVDITNTCTLNGLKDGFTSTDVTAGDLVWYELAISTETSTIGELTYSYYDDRYAVVDSSNGKTYSWKITSADGVPTVSLVEI